VSDQAKLFDVGSAEDVAAPAREAWSVARFTRALCLHGNARGRAGSFRVVAAVDTYATLPETVRTALREAAKAGLDISLGTATHAFDGPAQRVHRDACAVVRGDVPEAVELVLRLAGFKAPPRHQRPGRAWWGWQP
jgi:hypothetical protein